MKNVINFDEIDQYGPQRVETTLEIPAEELARDEVSRLGDVAADVEASRGDQPGEYVAAGEVVFTADLVCSRCLDPLPFANRSSFTVRYRPRSAAPATEESEELEVAGEELDVEYYTDRLINVRSLAIEQIQLAIPMKALCDDACQGLCPECGSNRNREECGCGESLTDPRWDALKQMREQLNRKKDI
jgi:uncharacterized protein